MSTQTTALHADQTKLDDPPTWRLLRRLARYLSGHMGRLWLASIALLLAASLGLVHPKLFGRAIDAAFRDQDFNTLNQMAAGLLALFGLQAIFVFIRHYLFSWLGERVVADLRLDVYSHLLRLPQSYFHSTRSGVLLSRLADDVTRLQGVVSEDLSMALRNSIALLGSVGMLVWINPVLAGTMLAVVPPLIIAVTYWGRIIRKLSRQAQDELAQASGSLQEGIAAIDTVQAFTREDYESNRYRVAISRVFGLFVRRSIARASFMSTASFVGMSVIAGIFWLGGRMVISGELTPGELTEFFLYTMAVAGAVGTMSGLASAYQQAVGATVRIFEILDTPIGIHSPEHPKQPEQIRGHVEFNNVSFAYGDREGAVVSNLSLDIPPGTMCALVGASGSGKSTVARLLQRFWDPSAGAILIDGIALPDYDLAELRSRIAVVSQEPVLFSGPILENIRYGRLSASDDEVIAAAKTANAHVFIESFPDGYQTQVGERGVKLSGGQKQRVAIARAILRDPKILILDEATSALDSESERLVQDALERLAVGRTTLVIAHRLSTVRSADQILVLRDGLVAESGTHRDLIAKAGIYAQLVSRQVEPSALDSL